MVGKKLGGEVLEVGTKTPPLRRSMECWGGLSPLEVMQSSPPLEVHGRGLSSTPLEVVDGCDDFTTPGYRNRSARRRFWLFFNVVVCFHVLFLILGVGYFLSGITTAVVIESRRKTAHLTCLFFEERQRWHARSLLYLDTLGVL